MDRSGGARGPVHSGQRDAVRAQSRRAVSTVRRGFSSRSRSSPSSNGCAARPAPTRRATFSNATRRPSSLRRPPRKRGCGRRGFSAGSASLDEALALVDASPPGGTDPYVRYLTDLVRGQILRARSRPEDAAKAYRDALTTWPGAQSARVALMTLALEPGRPAGSRDARRGRGDRVGLRQPVRSVVDLLAGRLPRLSRYRGETAGDRPMRCQPLLAFGLAGTIVAAIPAGAAGQQEPRATFRAGADAVAIEASVRRDKRPVTGLKAQRLRAAR